MSTSMAVNDTDLRLPPELERNLRKRAGQLRMLPAVAAEALEIARTPECSLSEFAAVVERDLKLASDILKIANSALYSPAVPITSLHRAVVRVGFRECQNLIIIASFASLMNRMSLEHEWVRSVLWRHSFNTALIALHLNRKFHFGFGGDEFTAGLMHDFGRMLFAVAMPDQFADIDSLGFEEPDEILDNETAVIGIDHCRLGAWFARENQLPEALIDVILHHHRPTEAKNARRLTALIRVADDMANHLQRFEETAGYQPEENPALPVLMELGERGFATHFCEVATALMQEAQKDAESLMQL